MIDRTHALPITRQAEIVNISRSSVYYESEPTSAADLRLMRRIERAVPGGAVRRRAHAA